MLTSISYVIVFPGSNFRDFIKCDCAKLGSESLILNKKN